MGTQTQAMPGADRDDQSGRFSDKYPAEAFIDAIEAEDGMAGTQAVADEVGCIYDTAYKKLRALEDRGRVESDKVGGVRLWRVS